MRVLGLLPIILGRDEYVVGASGAALLRGLVIRLMLLATPSRGGALRLDGVLPADRLAALATLPPIEATYDSVLAVHLACARVFLPLARSLVGEGWPVPIERALHGHLSRTLGIDLAAVERDTLRTGTGTHGTGSGTGNGSARQRSIMRLIARNAVECVTNSMIGRDHPATGEARHEALLLVGREGDDGAGGGCPYPWNGVLA